MGVAPFPGQPPAPMFERGASFQAAVPSIAGPVGLGAGTTLQPPAAFPVDAYGSSLSVERPKKVLLSSETVSYFGYVVSFTHLSCWIIDRLQCLTG